MLLSAPQHWEGKEKCAAAGLGAHCLVIRGDSAPWPAEMEAMLC